MYKRIPSASKMRVILILLLTRHALSWYSCDRRLCFNETNGLCNTSQERSSKKKYCDVSVRWKESCRTDNCYYIFDTSQSTINNDIRGTITSLKKMIISNDVIDLSEISAYCWSYMMLPDNVNHFYYKSSRSHLDFEIDLDIAVDFKFKGAHDTNYVVSIPCDDGERYPSLLRKDVIIYFLNDPWFDFWKGTETEYKIRWIATANKKRELSSWKHLGNDEKRAFMFDFVKKIFR